MEALGFKCIVKALPEEFFEDFAKKSFWNFYFCTKDQKKSIPSNLVGLQESHKKKKLSSEEEEESYILASNLFNQGYDE